MGSPNQKTTKTERASALVGKMEQRSENPTEARAAFALRCLQAVGCPKEWALRLGISPEYVRMMIRGERPLLEKFILDIARGHKFFSRRVKAFDDWADRVIEEQYGSADPSNF